MEDFSGFAYEVISWPFMAALQVFNWLWDFLFGWF